MPYIGPVPATAFQTINKQDFSVSATTNYTLSQSVTSANDIALFINNVRQEPTAAYSASGTALTLTEATSGSDDMYCVYLGKSLGTINPGSGSVGTSQLVDTAVTGSKINTDAISAQTELTTEPADTDEFLVSDSGVLKRMDYSLIKTEGTTAQAWVNFNGTGTVAIRASDNVSSITDNGTGDYTVNFTTALSDTDYVINPSTANTASPGTAIVQSRTTADFRVRTYLGGNGYILYQFGDKDEVEAAVFR